MKPSIIEAGEEVAQNCMGESIPRRY